MHQTQIDIRERDGYSRRSFPRTRTHHFAQGRVAPDAKARLFDDTNRELPVQVDVISTWDDGSSRDVEVTFAPTLDAGARRVYRLELGDHEPEAAVKNPVTVETTDAGLVVRQGVIEYTLRGSGYNFVDEVVFRERPFLHSGSRGPVVTGPDKEDTLIAGEVQFTVTHHGPWMGGVTVGGKYADGRGFVTEMRFVSTKSWWSAVHKVEEMQQGETVWFEADLLLGDRLATAFGARRAASGVDTSWGVVTDGAFTVDTGAAASPAQAGLLRHEVTRSGIYRMSLPQEDPPTVWFHYLHGPPDDVVNTPAAAMAAGL